MLTRAAPARHPAARAKERRTVRAVLTGFAVSALLALTTGGAGPAGPLRPGGKAGTALPARLAAVWSAPADVHPEVYQTGPYAFTGDTAVLPGAGGSGVELHDPRTGAVRGAVPALPGYVITDVGFSAGLLILGHQAAGRRGDRFIAGYDPRTGAPRWRTAIPASPAGAPHASVSGATTMITPGAVVVLSTDRRDLTGFASSTGRSLWRRPLEPGCSAQIDSGAVVAIMRGCDGKPAEVTALDPATGLTLWRREVPRGGGSEGSSLVTAADGTMFVAANGSSFFAAPDGRWSGELHAETTSTFGAYGDVVAVGSTEGRGERAVAVLRGIGRASGKVLWTRRDTPAFNLGYRDVMLAGEGLFAGQTNWPRVPGGWPLPYFVTVVDPRDGTTRSLPVPAGDNGTELIGLSGDVLFVRHETPTGPRVTAYRPDPAPSLPGPAEVPASAPSPPGRAGVSASAPSHPGRGEVPASAPGPAELGGVSPSSWPDACSLVSPGDLTALGRGYRAYPRERRLGEVVFPHPVVCDLVAPTDRRPPVSLSVQWVAASVREAMTLFDDALAGQRADQWPVKRLAPGLYQVAGPSIQLTPDTALIRWGPVIARLTVHGDVPGMKKIAPIVLANMRARLRP
ncbi:PQQ-binding-like beta-propeller repeat protein [Sphaerisporangium sp. NPDC005288]|uniref:outer membrane protein assembly factor BamB family protein n=1 Tax=Sphaerisporangium sp. NPDC005288 TaxID=3155114 RepID=UPI0033A62A6C